MRAPSARQLYCALAVVAASASLTSSMPAHAHSFGVVIDAGSSGSRIRVYEWAGHWADDNTVRPISQPFQWKNESDVGISGYVNDLPGLQRHLLRLIGAAKNSLVIPVDRYESTNLYLMATAGMRLLSEAQASKVMKKIVEVFSDKNKNPFAFIRRNARILSGEEEGAFAWIAVNFLRNVFNTSGRVNTVGVLEMGGASTQIAFIPDDQILADKFPVKVAGRIYPLYVHSYLNFGQERTQQWVKNAIVAAATKEDTGNRYDNPCQLTGDSQTTEINGTTYTFEGKSSPEECSDILRSFIRKAPDSLCFPKPCAIGTVYQPSVGSTRQFYAIAAYWYTLDALDVLADNGTFTINRLNNKANGFCRKSLSDVLTDKIGRKYASAYCMMGQYSSLLFDRGYGFGRQSRQLYGVPEIDQKSLEWTLGAIIYESERTGWSHNSGVLFPPSASPSLLPSLVLLTATLLTTLSAIRSL